MDNITFYKFVEIKDLKKTRELILNKAKSLNLKGKILLAPEGINGYMSGEDNEIKEFETFMQSQVEFKDIWFKHNYTEKFNSKRMLVKIRKEIITMKKDYDYSKTGKYLSPKELDELYQNNDDFVIFDTRNEYEYEMGHFKNAIKLDTKEFTEFPKEIEKYKDIVKDKKAIFYCTGGVRCEKATAWVKENGFDDVYQLDGGVVNYGIERGQGNWEGRLFVFDDRGAIKIDPKEQENDKYIQCSICFVPNEDKHICLYCNNEYIMCSRCVPLIENTCSKFCRNKMRDIKEKELEKVIEIKV